MGRVALGVGSSEIRAAFCVAPEAAAGTDLFAAVCAKGADLLIYDGMYTPEEYETKYKGWGHSTWEKGFEVAKYAGSKNTWSSPTTPTTPMIFWMPTKLRCAKNAGRNCRL